MFRTFVIVNALVGFVFGVTLLFVPAFLASLYDLHANDTALLLARFFGAEALGYNALTLFALPHASNGTLRRGLVAARCLSEGSLFVVALLARLAGIGNDLFWSVVAITFIFTLGSVFFLLRPSWALQN